ncbi:MAG: hypothetical protein NT046_12550 [Arenimonas sp.]|nr:hypothetical protein [Arenimonas sp.]
MIRSTLFLAVLATGLAAPASADDTFRSPSVADSKGAGKLAAARADRAAKAGRISPAAVTVEEVGDAGSFGKPVKWLGLMSGFVYLSTDCTPPAGEPADPNCVTLNPAPATTVFNAVDLASITLPGKSSQTLLCHWQTPIVSYRFANDTLSAQIANFRATPRYRIESEVLDDPALINPSTGVAFGGQLELPLTAFAKSKLVEPGYFESETLTSTRMCIGGLVSKASLVDQYGLTEAQATQFFRKPITITLSISGQARMVDNANINFGTRITGD